jgi:hypothetical protein
MMTNGVGSWFKVSRVNISASKEPYSPTRGGNF